MVRSLQELLRELDAPSAPAVLVYRQPSTGVSASLEWDESDMEIQHRFGVVDAHAVRLLSRDPERWFVTGDERLEAHALEAVPGRVVRLSDAIFG